MLMANRTGACSLESSVNAATIGASRPAVTPICFSPSTEVSPLLADVPVARVLYHLIEVSRKILHAPLTYVPAARIPHKLEAIGKRKEVPT
jgi:hypothetical protein